MKTFTCWNQLLVMMFGQLSSCDSLREVICIISAIKNKSYHLGFGSGDIKLSNVAYANANRDYRIFEEFAYYMINLAQSKRLDREFILHGKFYAFDSTTIDLCLSLFQWASFYEPDPANPKPAYKRTDRHILSYDKNAHTITEKQTEGKKTYTFEEYDEVVQERKQTDFFEPYVFDVR